MELELLLVGDVFLQAHGAHTCDNLLDSRHGVDKRLVGFAGNRHPGNHDALARLAIGEVLPQFLGDKRHERVEHTQERVEEAQCGVECGAVDRLLISRFNHFEIPR